MTNRIEQRVAAEQSVWRAPDAVEFFQTHRDTVGDLYPSERRFLPELLPQVSTVLDVGCAAGGFSQIMRAFNPNLSYTGIDVIEEFVAIAQKRHPESRFELGDGIHFQTPAESYDMVHSSGILHHNSRYREIVAACYRQAKKYLLCDFRLTDGPGVQGTFRINFNERDEARPDLPYIVLNRQELVDVLCALSPAPKAIRFFGYLSRPSQMATLPLQEILMTFVLIEKGPPTGSGPTVDWEIASKP